jgi:TPR repeat protein
MYEHGDGVAQNYAEAVKWYRLAADQGDADAQFFLGTMYEQGHGVPQDYVQAHMWYNLAGAQGHVDGVKFRDKMAGSMTPGQIAEAQRLASGWKPKGTPTADILLGHRPSK